MGERRQHPSKRNQERSPHARSTQARRTSTSSSSGRTPRPPRTPRPRPSTARSTAGAAKLNRSRPTKSRPTKSEPDQPKLTRPATRPKVKKSQLDRLFTSVRRSRKRRRTTRIPLGSGTRRVRVIGIAMAIAISLCAGRLLQLQGFDSAAYGAIATANLTTTTPLLPARGEITGRDGTVLAGTEPAVDITADPTLTSQDCSESYVGPLCGLAQANKIADIISEYTPIDRRQVITALMRHDTRFVYVKKKVPAHVYTDISTRLDDAGLPGIYRESNPIRTYPSGKVASNVVGFVNSENEGQSGIEYQMNESLAGVEGKESYESAPNGSRIPLGESTVTPARNGINYQLTIDPALQWVAQRRLEDAMRKTRADSATAITIDVTTGQILAMADTPGYDPSDPGAADPDNLGTRAVSRAYEPGSVQKVLTSAALIDSGAAEPETRVSVPGSVASGGGRIKDHYSHGTLQLNMRGIVSHSSNIGTVLLTRQLDKATLHNYLSSFGLGEQTGIGLPGESAGSLPPADMKDYTRDQISFGQGLSVTAVQEAAAIAAVVNGGVYNSPTVVKSATQADGTPVDLDRPSPRRVVSEETSAKIRDLMESVVARTPSVGSQLMLDHYSSGGKTGTAERYEPTCGCYRGYVTSFVGFAPLDDPKLLTYVVVDNPKRGESGSETAAPVYTDIMEFALPRYGVAPDQKNKEAGLEHMDRELRW